MKRPTVLVVEDDDDARRLLVAYLKSRSCMDVDAARDGIEALHLLSTNEYAVLILDVMMPKMSGVDLLDSIHAMQSDRSVKALSHPPTVIVMTSASEAVLSDETLHHHASGLVRRVLRKPLQIEQLADAVEALARR